MDEAQTEHMHNSQEEC